MEKALELRDVSIVRKGKYILRSVDLDIFKGENVAVIGPNGSGKTTLIKLLRGDIRPYYDEDHPAVMRIFGMERWNLFDIRGRMGVVSMDLQSMFRPETRVDEVICFNRLDEQNFAGIARIMLSELQKSLEDKGLHFTWDEAVEEYLVKKSYSATYGARNLRRTIQKDLEDTMAAQIIDSYEHPVTQIRASMEDGKLVVRSM